MPGSSAGVSIVPVGLAGLASTSPAGLGSSASSMATVG